MSVLIVVCVIMVIVNGRFTICFFVFADGFGFVGVLYVMVKMYIVCM